MNRTPENKYLEGILVFVIISIIPLISTKKTLDPGLHIQFCLLAFSLLVYWLVIIIKKKGIVISNRAVLLFLIVAIVLVFYSMVSVIISTNTADALFFLSKYLLFFILLITCTFFLNSGNLFNHVSRAIIILSTIILVPGYFQLFNLLNEKELIIPISTYSIRSVFPHRNLFSEVLCLTLPVSVYYYFSKNNIWKYLGILNFNSALLLIILLSNRATWLAVMVSGVTVLLILFLSRQKLLFQKIKIVFALNTLLVVIIGAFIFLNYSDTSTLKKHTLNSLDFKKGSAKDRIELWKRTLNLINEKPITGEGLGSWKINMLKYGNEGLASENNTTFYQRPHNDFLWVAAEQGLIGLCLYIILFVLILFNLIKSLLIHTDAHFKRQLLTILSVTLGYLVFSFLSFPKERIVHNIILYLNWGIFLSILNSKKNQESKLAVNSKSLSVIFFVLIGIQILGLFRFNGEIHTKMAILAKNSTNFRKCIREINKAKSYFYSFDETSTPLDWYLGLSYFKLKEYPKALNHFDTACQLNPFHIYVLNDYAGCLVKLEQQEKAAGLYQKAISISPNFTEAKLNLCALYFNNDDNIKAFNVLKSIDTNTSTERYKKAVVAIIGKLISDYIKTQQPNDGCLYLYNKKFNNYDFYKGLLLNAIKYNLQSTEIVDHYKKLLKPDNT